MEIIKIEKTNFECQNKNIVDAKVNTICGLSGYVGIDNSLDRIYGSLPNGLIYFSDIYEVVTDELHNNVWYAYAYNTKTQYVELRDGVTHGMMHRTVKFLDFKNAFKNVLTN